MGGPHDFPSSHVAVREVGLTETWTPWQGPLGRAIRSNHICLAANLIHPRGELVGVRRGGSRNCLEQLTLFRDGKLVVPPLIRPAGHLLPQGEYVFSVAIQRPVAQREYRRRHGSIGMFWPPLPPSPRHRPRRTCPRTPSSRHHVFRQTCSCWKRTGSVSHSSIFPPSGSTPSTKLSRRVAGRFPGATSP